jgi:enamidase
VALTHVRVIDGTGAPAREDQTVVIRDGRIASIGPASSTPTPAEAQTIDLAGKSVIPGLVMVHEHLHYPTGPGIYGNLIESFTRLYLAGGVTSMRTAGNVIRLTASALARLARRSHRSRRARGTVGSNATAPYIQAAGMGIAQMHEWPISAEARRMVRVLERRRRERRSKAFMNLTRDMLRATDRRGPQARDEGDRPPVLDQPTCECRPKNARIDNHEPWFLRRDRFRGADQAARRRARRASRALTGAGGRVDPSSEPVKSLRRFLIERNDRAHHHAPRCFEDVTPGLPCRRDSTVLEPQLKAQFEQRYAGERKQPEYQGHAARHGVVVRRAR